MSVPALPSVSIVILNWNNAPDTLACLRSVLASDYPNYRVLVVDNGSTDDSVACIRAAYPEIALLETGENLGYAGGNNVGIRTALEQEAEYVLLLNNDTKANADMLSQLVEVAESDPQIGMVGPMTICMDGPGILFAAGSSIDWAHGKLVHRGMWEPVAVSGHLMKSQPVDFVVGSAVLVRRNVIQHIGLLDVAYYLNFEDVEWCARAWRQGYQVWYASKAILEHRVSGSLGQGSPANTYYMTRNALLFFWTHAPGIWKVLAPLQIILRTARTIAAWTLKPQYRTDAFRRKRDANLFALRDFFLGRFGKMGPDVERVCYGP